LVNAIEKVIQTSSNDPQEQQFKESMKQATLAKLVSEATKNQSTAEMQNAKAGATGATATYDLAMAQRLIAENDHEGFVRHLSAMVEQAKAEKAKADTQHANAKTAREIVGLHGDMAASGAAAAQQHSDLADASTSRALQVHDSLHKATNDRANTALAHISTLAGAHRDLAAAHRDRVGAMVDARPEPQNPVTP
jgi:hypothetical protein